MIRSYLARLHKPVVVKSLAFFFAFVFFPSLLLADVTIPGSLGSISITNPVAGGGTIWSFITLIINNIVLPLGGILAVLYIMYAGFIMVTAQGDEGKIETGRAAFFNAAIGTAILLGSWVIANVIANTICSLKGGTMSGSSCSV